jgi:alkylhydroperoxidase/carboxymuconolactone decarboxylase family protein YurZ
MVLRCDDCIAYHVDQCVKVGLSDEQLFEAFDVALLVGGSIVIPHLRRAVEFLDEARVKALPQ